MVKIAPKTKSKNIISHHTSS